MSGRTDPLDAAERCGTDRPEGCVHCDASIARSVSNAVPRLFAELSIHIRSRSAHDASLGPRREGATALIYSPGCMRRLSLTARHP